MERRGARSLLGQTEPNPYTGGKINRLPVAFRRPEAHLLCRLNSCFIKTVAQAVQHSCHLQLARSEENHLEDHITFDPKSAAFGGIDGIWLVQNVDTRGYAYRGRPPGLLGILCGSDAPDPASTGSAIAIAGTARKKRRARMINIGGPVGISRTRETVGVTKTPGLHLVERCSHSYGRRIT